MLPGPPPVHRCGVCCSVLEQFNLFSSLLGASPASVQCNSRSGCTCALPIVSLPSSAAPTHISVAHSKDQVRSLLRNRPPHSTCLLVPSRAVTGLQDLLRSSTLIHTFDSDTPIGHSINALQAKPSKILTFHVPPDFRDTGQCQSLAHTEMDKGQLEMIFRGTVKAHPLKVLFDSGASACFIGQSTVKKLGLDIRPSSLKSVATAAGKSVSIQGSVTLQLQLGPALVDVTAHILPEFLSQVQLIIGQDFMKSNNVCLGYNPSRCIIHSETQDELILERSHPSQSKDYHPPPSAVESNRLPDYLPDQISAVMAARLIKRNPEKAYVALIKPFEIAPPSLPNEPKPVPSSTADLAHVPPELTIQLQALMGDFSGIFSETPQAGGALVDTLEHAIKLIPGSKAPFRRNYRFSPLELEELRKQVTEFLSKGIVTPSNSPFGAPVLFIPKPGGGLRFCLDYRALNDITVKTRYQLPRIDDLLDAARGAQYFSCLDMASGYYQLRIAEEDMPKTAFATPFGHFEWRVLPMGLTNAPSSFQRTMQKVFEKFIGDFVLVYLDDILILSKTAEDHLKHLRQVFTTLQEHRFQIKLSKCKFMQEQVKYLGHILSRDGIQADPAKVQTLLDWEMPSNTTGMLQFLGLANYFRKFIPNYSRLAAPLYHLTKKSVTFQKGEEVLLAFQAIKDLLMSPPLLAYPNPDLPYELISDASITGCGAVLVQEGKPLAYFSSKFCPAERNYTTGEQELLGIIKALKEWRCYLEGCQGLTLVTDHNPLTFFSVQPTLSRRQARWSEFLSRFHFVVKYRPGATNPADPLSRLFGHTALSLLAVTVNEFNSDLLARIKEGSLLDPHFEDSKETRKYTQESGYWTYQGRIVVPASMQTEIITEHHANVVSGHFSWSRTLDLVSRQFWWPGMRDSIQSFVQSCLSCQKNKASTKRPFGLLKPLEIPDSRWHTVTLDFIMDLPKSADGNNAILVLVDKLTKYVHLVPTRKTCTSEDVSRLFLTHIYQFHGVPKVLISDRDSRFTSEFWRAFCKRLGIQPRFSTAFHPQTDGQTERTNRVLEEVIRHFIDGDHKNWEDLLPLAAFAMNNAKSSSTGETPFYLNHGSHPLTPITLGLPEGRLPTLECVFQDLDSTLTRIRALLQAAQDRQKTYADARFRAPHTFKVGDQVLLSTRNLKFKKGVKKFHPKYIGPFQITEIIPGSADNAVRLELPATYSRIHPVFHVSLLKIYRASATSSPLPPSPSVEDGIPLYKVENILSHRERRVGKRKIQEFLIKWLGYDDTHNSWEPKNNLTPDLLQAYKF